VDRLLARVLGLLAESCRMATQRCNCGFHTDPTNVCRCSPHQIQRYRSRISGPLLDRIDLHIDVPKVKFDDLASERKEESSIDIRKRVNAARIIQRDRFKKDGIYNNASISSRHIKKFCNIDEDSKRLLSLAINKFGLSARAYDRILKVGRTIADLAKEENIKSEHIAEAIQYRILDREFE